jgi:PucR C-terminal helix-turn-helix domain/GGDEF-like domain
MDRGLLDAPAPAPAPAAELLREVAARLLGQADEIAWTMIGAYEAEIPAYAGISDPALKEDVHSVSSALVRSWLTVMSRGESVDPELLAPMLEGARRRAAQGIDLQSMLRAYRVGIRVMWGEITASAVWHERRLEGVMAQVAAWALDYADKISTAVAAAYLEETEQLAREREHRRSALLNAILAGPAGETIDRPAELECRHSVAVARVASGLSLLELEQAGELLERGADALIWTVRHRSVVAALPWPAGADRTTLRTRLCRVLAEGPITAVGLGGPAEGVAETRASYGEATAALRIGPLVSSFRPAVYDHQELAPLVALLERPEHARRFALGTLEPLGELVKRPWHLPTLEAYLVHQGRTKEAAADLGVHPNTVKYRLKELRSHLGPAFADGDRGVSLLLALRTIRVLEAERAAPSAPSA